MYRHVCRYHFIKPKNIDKEMNPMKIDSPPPPLAQLLLVGQGFLIIEASRSHLNTPQSVGLLWTSDQPVVETSIWQHTTLTTGNIHAPGGIRTRNPSKRAAPYFTSWQRGDWDRLWQWIEIEILLRWDQCLHLSIFGGVRNSYAKDVQNDVLIRTYTVVDVCMSGGGGGLYWPNLFCVF